MKVGMVLCVYDQSPETLCQCLKSIEAQTYRDFRLILVMDGTHRDTVKAAHRMAGDLSIPYECIQRQEQKGLPVSLNEAFSKLMDCEHLTWLSGHNRLEPDFLHRLVREFEQSPQDVVLVYSMYHIISKDGHRLSDDLWYRDHSMTRMSRAKQTILQDNFVGTSFLFKRAAYQAAGGFDPRYEKAADYEFWIRLVQTGEIRFVPKFLMEYRIGGKVPYTIHTPLIERDQFQCIEASLNHRKRSGKIPKVSVILTGYNKERHIRKAVESVLNQTYKDFQLILINDGSHDGTWDILSTIYDERITSVNLTNNRGPAGVLNVGLQLALGEYVLEMDGDDWLEPDALEKMVRTMEKLPKDVAMVGANKQNWLQKGDRLIKGRVRKWRRYRNKYAFVKHFLVPAPRLYRKSALLAVGGWPSRIKGEKVVVDDVAIMLRLIARYRFYWLNQTLYHYRLHSSNTHVTGRLLHQRQLRYLIKRTLRKWGGAYKPVFIVSRGYVRKIRLIKRKKGKFKRPVAWRKGKPNLRKKVISKRKRLNKGGKGKRKTIVKPKRMAKNVKSKASAKQKRTLKNNKRSTEIPRRRLRRRLDRASA